MLHEQLCFTLSIADIRLSISVTSSSDCTLSQRSSSPLHLHNSVHYSIFVLQIQGGAHRCWTHEHLQSFNIVSVAQDNVQVTGSNRSSTFIQPKSVGDGRLGYYWMSNSH